MTLKLARLQAGIKLKDVAEKLSVTPTAVNGWETGRAEPKFTTVKKLCEIYGVDLNEIEL